jgi:hypothetical protein
MNMNQLEMDLSIVSNTQVLIVVVITHIVCPLGIILGHCL